MPLPSNGTLSLLGSGTGADPSGKHAMIVRMSAETLEALEDFPDHPQMDFEFGDSPGIHIGETFFPMRPLKEAAPHELYLRLPSASKPMAPLRLHANVIGKFTVERELGEKVTGKVRDRTLVAEKQRSERKAIMLDAPPTLSATNGKKRKAPQASSSMFRNPIKPGNDSLNRSTPSAPPSSRITVPPPTEEINSPRMCLIHCLAISPRLSDDVLRLVGGPTPSDSYKEELLAILHDVGEQTEAVKKGADKSNSPWCLKTRSWLEVRPYEWTKLNDADRTAVARQARLAFNDMKIPESDPAWGHVRYRNVSNKNSNGSGSGASSAIAGPSRNASTSKVETAAKRGVSSQEKKSKPGKKKEEAVQMKDESLKTGRVSDAKSKEVGARGSKVSDSAAAPGQAVRRPGSGYKAPSHSAHDSRSGSADSNRIPRMSNTTGSADSRPTQKRDAASPSLPPKPAPEVLANQERERKPSSTMRMSKKGREPMTGRGTDSDWERNGEGRIPKRRAELESVSKGGMDSDRETTARIKKVRELVAGGMDSDRGKYRDRLGYKPAGKESDKDKEKERERRDGQTDRGGNKDTDREYGREIRDREQKERDWDRDRAPSVGTKRKKSNFGQEEVEVSHDSPPKVSFQKKRRTEDGAVAVPSTAPSSNPRNLSLPKKPELPSIPTHSRHNSVIKREQSPLPPPRRSLPSSGKVAVESSSSSNRTSKANGNAKSRRKSPIYTSSEEEAETTRRPPKREQASASLPPAPSPAAASTVAPSSVSHRPRLSVSDHASLRSRYRSSWQDYIAIVAKVVAQKTKIEALLDSNSVDSDGDVDLLDAEELEKLSARHMALRGELESIKRAYERGESGSD